MGDSEWFRLRQRCESRAFSLLSELSDFGSEWEIV